jgi:Gamma-glutamyl cyclotransferase, AIG2-like
VPRQEWVRRFFFYGTLMDCDLLSRVLGRPIAPSKLVPAVLRGYSRSAVQGLPYPVVLREPTASVNGVVLGGITAAQCNRLRRYEGENYFLMRGVAEFGQEPARSVLLFVPQPGAFVATGEPWSLMRWRSHAKSKVLHSAIMALLLFTCGLTPGLRQAEAATVSATNPN